MTLIEKLERLKALRDQNKEPDWDSYKENWKSDINNLQQTIMERWFGDYSEKGLMSFDIVPTKRIESYLGEYLTATLEITLVDSKFIVLEPTSAVTSEYDGKLELYMRGNVYKKVSILRKINDDGTHDWIVAKSLNKEEHVKLDKAQMEKLIDEWLQ